jgi:CubicO group peptidase (beta-lactamase class C family)
MATTTGAQLTQILQRINVPLTEEQLRAHEILPANVKAAHSARGTVEQLPKLPALTPQPRHVYTFDGKAFCDSLHADLASKVAGYAMRMQQHGRTIYTLEWNWAKEPQDGGVGWNPERRMHVASCSKLVTAIAMTKLLDERNLSFDTKIIDYLPKYWAKGPGVDQVTFRHLLTQRSGFHFGQNESPSDYAFMKSAVALGTSHVGQYNYQNMNFGLCRILLATLNGNIPVDFTSPILEDAIWDMATISDYQAYCTANVFGPGRVMDASLAHADSDVLAYPYPVAGNGWNSGDLTAVAGGAAWHLTIDDLLGIMGAFRRNGSIVSATQAQAMLDNGFGLDWIASTPLGNFYAKNGGWADGAGRTEQCVAFFFPQDIECVVFVNSPIGASNEFLMGQVGKHYTDNVK